MFGSSNDHPIIRFGIEALNIVPSALDKKDIAAAHLSVGYLVGDITVAAPYPDDVDVVGLTQSGVAYTQPFEARIGHYDYFGKPHVVKFGV